MRQEAAHDLKSAICAAREADVAVRDIAAAAERSHEQIRRMVAATREA
jgi:hypothetical protein